MVLLSGVAVVFISATCFLADDNDHKSPFNPGAPKKPPIHDKPPTTNFKERDTKPQPLGGKPPKNNPPPAAESEPSTPQIYHDIERKEVKPPSGNFRGNIPMQAEEADHHDVNRDHKPLHPPCPNKPPHIPPTN